MPKRSDAWRARVWGAVACGALAAPLLAAPPAGPQGVTARAGSAVGAHVRPNVRMNAVQLSFPQGMLGRAAEAVAADPEGRVLVAAWETVQGNCGPPLGVPCAPPKSPGQTEIGWSADGGRTWTDVGAPPEADGAITAGHPWLDRGGRDGRTFFLVSRGRDAKSGFLNGVLVYRGQLKDGAFAWRDGHLFRGANQGDILRSSSVLAAKDGSGAVFVAVSNIRGLCGMASRGTGQIEIFRSGDGGDTWEGPTIVGPDDTVVTPDPRDPRCAHTGTIQIAPTMAMGPGGEVYVIWPHGPRYLNYVPSPILPPTQFHTTETWDLRFARSLDGAKTFGPAVDVATQPTMRDNPPAGFSKDNILDFPRLAVAAGGAHRGRLYAAFAAPLAPVADLPSSQPVPVSSQVYLVRSDDRGQSWSKPLPLGPPVPPSGVKRFFPSVAVEAGGDVVAVYAESQERQVTADPHDVECATSLPSGLFRKGEVSSLVDLWAVRSRDGGASFGPPRRITTETSNWCTAYNDPGGFLMANFGDYLGIFPGQDRTFTVWTDGRGGVPDAYFAEIRGDGAP